MTQEVYIGLEARVTSLEKGQVRQERFFELMDKVDKRLTILEKHDEEFMLMVHQSCTLKDKDIQTSREEAIRISTEHANKVHEQTMRLMGGMFFMFISALVYFNYGMNENSLAIREGQTNISSIHSSIDKMDTKMDSIIEKLNNHHQSLGNN